MDTELEQIKWLDNVPQPIIIVDITGKILYANSKINEFLPSSFTESITNMYLHQFLDDKSKQRATTEVSEIILHDAVVKNEYQIFFPDGSMKWVLTNANRIRFGDGFADLVSLQDITESKALYETILNREKLLSCTGAITNMLNAEPELDKAINNALALLGEVMGVDRTYIFENSTDTDGTLMMNYRYEWVNDKVDKQIDNPDLQRLPYNILSETILAHITNKTPYFGIVKNMDEVSQGFLVPQGIVSLILFPLFINDWFWGFVGFDDCFAEREWLDHEVEVLRIISNSFAIAIKRKHKELELMESESRYKQLYSMLRLMCDTMPEMIWAKDTDRKFLFANKAVCEKLLLTSDTDEPIGQTDMYFVNRERNLHPDNPHWHTFGELCIDSDAVVLKDKTLHQFDEYGNVKGEFLYLDVNKAPMFDENGVLIGTVGCGRDVTLSKKTEQELIHAKEKAVESDKLKSAFLANMSHEIRTPMNGILGFVELLSDKKLTQDERAEYIGTINKCSNQLLAIISEIVEISIIETNQAKIKLSSVNLSSLLDDVYKNFSHKGPANGQIQFELLIANQERSVVISTDEVKLSLIITNLLDNAFKYTESGKIVFGYRVKDTVIEFFVSDTGIGIDCEHHNVIFDRFRQIESHLIRTHGGTGLGLAICKAYVEMLGGEIWLKSSLHNGATFFFTIPNNAVILLKPNVPPQKTTEFDFRSKTILIAEDDDINFNYLNIVLNKTGAEILHAWNGAETIELYHEHPQVNLILMDIRMPIKNGLETTLEIRKTDQKIPIVALTAYAYEDEKLVALETGCTDYLSKPINGQKLLETINKHLK